MATITSTLQRTLGALLVLCLSGLALRGAPLGADMQKDTCVRSYGALGDGSGAVATQSWLSEKGYPIAASEPDHTVIGIVFGGKTDNPRIKTPEDGDRWYSCEWSSDKVWHYLFGIAEYRAETKEWRKVPIQQGQTVYVQNENAHYVAVGTSRPRLRKAYVPDVDTMDYVGIQEAAYANPLGRLDIPRGHYKLNRGVSLHKLNCCIVGENCHGTVVENTGEKGEDLFYITNYGFRDNLSRRPTIISDLTLLGNDKSGRGIVLFTAGFYTVERVRLREHGGDGLYINSCLGINVLQTYFRDCSLRTEGWANCFALDTVEMRGLNTYLWAEGIEVGTIKNLCIEGVTANENIHKFVRCSNVQIRDLYTEVLGVTDASVPIVEIGPRCEQLDFYNCRFTMHREAPKSEYLIDAAPDTHGIRFSRCRVNRVEAPYPKIRNQSHRGVLRFDECTFAKIGAYEGAVRFTSPQLSWVGTRPILQRDPRVETLCRTDSTVVTRNLVGLDSDCNGTAHFVAVKGAPVIALQPTGGYQDSGGCVRIEGKKGDVVELAPESLEPFSETYVFPFWMMRCDGEAGAELTSHWNLGKYYLPMPVMAWRGWRLNMILNAQPRLEGTKAKPVFRLAFNEDATIYLDRLHVVQSPFYTPALWDDYNYVASGALDSGVDGDGGGGRE